MDSNIAFRPRLTVLCIDTATANPALFWAVDFSNPTVGDRILETLVQLEATGLSIWMRESGPAFFTALVVHALAMGFVVGINIVLSLRLTGFAAAIPLHPLQKFYPLHWVCVVLIVVSGLGLLLAYPAKALTNPVFYIKLAALSTALSISYYFQLQLRLQSANAHVVLQSRMVVNLAFLTLILWLITITAGRFLAYTNSLLLASHLF